MGPLCLVQSSEGGAAILPRSFRAVAGAHPFSINEGARKRSRAAPVGMTGSKFVGKQIGQGSDYTARAARFGKRALQLPDQIGGYWSGKRSRLRFPGKMTAMYFPSGEMAKSRVTLP